ncbi:MAG: hypothetical protein ABS74_07745 [Pelagibacterium sp. SCN 63-126]|nr:MAG: hypothetical protein ABS74_07745 [Pelagibacterium sp. SCN 63-126]
MQATTTMPLFAATLRPDRTLRAAGGWVALVIAGIVGTPFLFAIPDFLVPGLVAYGLAIAGLSALSVSQSRRARKSQQITLWPDQLEILSEDKAGKALKRLDPKLVRLRLERDDNERTTGIFLVLPSEEIELGRFLANDDKSSFARAFGRALRQARQRS